MGPVQGLGSERPGGTPASADCVTGLGPFAIGRGRDAQAEEGLAHWFGRGTHLVSTGCQDFRLSHSCPRIGGPGTSGESDWGACGYDGVGPGSRHGNSFPGSVDTGSGDKTRSPKTVGSTHGQSGVPAGVGRSQRLAIAASRVRSRLLFLVLDALILGASYSLAELVYVHNTHTPAGFAQEVALFLVVALAVQLLANHLFGLYGRMWRHAGIEEARQIVLLLGGQPDRPVRPLPVGPGHRRRERGPSHRGPGGGVFGDHGHGGTPVPFEALRLAARVSPVGTRVAVIGSRDAGAAVVRDMLRNPKAGAHARRRLRRRRRRPWPVPPRRPGGRWYGRHRSAATRYDIQQVVLAIPSPSSDLVERALRASESAGITMKIVPGVREMAGDTGKAPPMARVRSPRIEDLLGRTQVATDLEAVRRSIAGRRVLITGAGGSIGTEISRQVAGFEPAMLVLVDHDETHLYDTAALVNGPVSRCSWTSATARPCSRPCGGSGPRSSSTPPPTSTCPCSSPTPWRPSRPTSSGP